MRTAPAFTLSAPLELTPTHVCTVGLETISVSVGPNGALREVGCRWRLRELFRGSIRIVSVSFETDDVLAASVDLPYAWLTSSFGEQVRALRLQRGLSQRALAEMTGISAGDISRLEAGRDARLSTVRHLIESMGYLVALAAVNGCEEAEDLAAERMEERRERMREHWRSPWIGPKAPRA